MSISKRIRNALKREKAPANLAAYPRWRGFTYEQGRVIPRAGGLAGPQFSESFARPYSQVPVVSDFHKTQGERPPVEFETLRRHWNIPQVSEGIDIWRNLIVGSGLTVNCTDPEAKAVIEKWMIDTDFENRLKNVVTLTLVYGIGMFTKQREGGEVVGIEDFDTSNFLWAWRDKYGNPEKIRRIYPTQGNQVDHTVDRKKDVFLKFRPYNREFFGLSRFHALSIWQVDGERVYKPVGDAVIAMNDAVLGAAEVYTYPREFITPENQDEEAMEEIRSLVSDYRPRMSIVTKEVPKVYVGDQSNNVSTEPLVRQANALVGEAMGFPIDIMRGEFTSRASSKTTEHLYMKNVRTYQSYTSNMLEQNIFKDVLINHNSGKWKTEEAYNDLALNVIFNDDDKTPFTVDEVINLYRNKIYSLEEARQYCRSRGQDLFTPNEKLPADEELSNSGGNE